MTYSELREKVEHQIAQLPLERLFLVSSFIRLSLKRMGVINNFAVFRH
jgi:hypothetical protein